ncbi:MAG: A/G-specific adenine glycosylase [Micromonosporaceae bacterium]|nr:A/G-specific adenine glycosylase [Micromonosporaceae bacterium]
MPAPPDLTPLFQWYADHARDLPWRRPETTPWGVLVSEVMLQQTPVNRVLPAWHAWMERWPTPADLAGDTEAEAIRMWHRLGYPRRALRLHQCARALTERHDGAIPRDVGALLALPGIGAYTARAVAAFAYRQRQPVVDTNVRRVVARVVDGRPDGGATTAPGDLAAAERLLPDEPEQAARLSVAIMELGALVCTARNPDCGACPLSALCAWRASGRDLPEGPTRRPQRYAGTDRQVRGLIMAVLRDGAGPVDQDRIDVVWYDDAQRSRALACLVADGLAVRLHGDRYALPGANNSGAYH